MSSFRLRVKLGEPPDTVGTGHAVPAAPWEHKLPCVHQDWQGCRGAFGASGVTVSRSKTGMTPFAPSQVGLRLYSQ